MRLFFRLFFIVVILLLPILLKAKNAPEKTTQEEDATPPITTLQIEEVIIEGSFKQNIHLQTKPIAASVVTEQDIQKQNIVSLTGLSALIPNLFVSDYGNKVSTPVFIRGIGSRTNPPAVGLYVDGIPYFDRSAFDFNMNDISRIEVLRGSQGTLYGRNTMGGIINVFTKSPLIHKGGQASLLIGNKNYYKGEASYYGQIGENFGYGIAANYLAQGGYFKNQYTQNYADKLHSTSGRIRLGWKFAPQWTAYLSSTYEYLDQNGFPYAPYDTASNSISAVNYNRDSYYYRNMNNNGLTLEHSNGKVKFTSQSSFQYFDGNQGVDQDFTTNDIFYVYYHQRQQLYSQEFNLRSLHKSRYHWVAGAFLFDQHAREGFNVHTIARQAQRINNTRNSSSGFALYHQSELRKVFIPQITLTAGVRFDYERIKLEATQATVAPDGTATPAPSITATNHFRQITPKFALQYTLDKDESIAYISVGKGYKAGGFNTAVDNETERTFKPEHSWTYEVGIKKSFADKTLLLQSNLFIIDWKNQQVARVRASGQGNKILNAGRSQSKGAEISLTMNIHPQISITSNYGYTFARFKKYINDEARNIDYSGNIIPLVPRHTLALQTNYRKTFKNNSSLDIALEYVGQGKIYWNETNIMAQPFYGLLNGTISYLKPTWAIHLWARNIADKSYITYQFSNQGQAYGQAGRPLTIGTKFNILF